MLPESVSLEQVNDVTVSGPLEMALVGIPVKLVPVKIGAVLGLTKVLDNAPSGIPVKLVPVKIGAVLGLTKVLDNAPSGMPVKFVPVKTGAVLGLTNVLDNAPSGIPVKLVPVKIGAVLGLTKVLDNAPSGIPVKLVPVNVGAVLGLTKVLDNAPSGMPVKLVPVKIGAVLGLTKVLANALSGMVEELMLAPLMTGAEVNVLIPEMLSFVDVCTKLLDNAASGMPVKLVPVKIGAVLGFTNVLANAASSTVPVDKLAPLITGGETNVLIPEILSLVDVCTKLLDNAPSGMPVKLVPVSVGAVLGFTNVLDNAPSGMPVKLVPVRTGAVLGFTNVLDNAPSGIPVKLVPVNVGAVLGLTKVLDNAASATVPADKLAPLITGGETNVLIPEILSSVDVCTKLLDSAPSGMPVKLVPVSAGAVLGFTNVLANAASATVPADKLAPLITGGETNVLIPEILSLVDVCTKLLDNAPSGMPVKLVPVSVGAVLGLTNVLANAASATAPFGTVNVPDKSRFRKLRSVVLLITACFPAKSVVRAATSPSLNETLGNTIAPLTLRLLSTVFPVTVNPLSVAALDVDTFPFI